MSYTRTTWVNETTPVNAANLNNMEDGIEEALENSEPDESVLALFEADGWTAPE